VAHAEDAGEAVRTSPSFGKVGSSGTVEAICRTMESSAADNNLSIEFFTRVIWQESRFNIRARSSAGVQGIAQFMPQTAASRGLLDPFDPFQSLPESASYLRELKGRFGNFGLAAAAYNAGPGRVARWLSGKTHLPAETVAYVRIVTGRQSPNGPQRNRLLCIMPTFPREYRADLLRTQTWTPSLLRHKTTIVSLKSHHGQPGEFSFSVISPEKKCWLAIKICGENIPRFWRTRIRFWS
jgi:hypothetical protein